MDPEQLELFPEEKPTVWKRVELRISSKEFHAIKPHCGSRGFDPEEGPWVETDRVRFYCERDRAGDEDLVEWLGKLGLSERTLMILKMKLGLGPKTVQINF